MKNLKIYEDFDKKPNLLIFQGSPRSKNSCADYESKSERVSKYIFGNWSEYFNIEIIDLSVGDITISPCKGCVSTSNGMHCHWKCTCYSKGMETPDLIYEKDIYEKLEKCDAFLVISPINWYSVSSQVKLLFDRLVCANLTLTKDQAVDLLGGIQNIKNSDITGPAEMSGDYKGLLKNHLEGKVASFYIHGDNGADDYSGKPPKTGDEDWEIKNSVMPLVYQCRYSGMICPDDLVEAFYCLEGIPYYQSNLEMPFENEFFKRADILLSKISKTVGII
jgi:multimeric flavodoxin WrbA